MTCTLTLLLVAQVAAEWVEISQQHYRKPIRTQFNLFTTPDKVIDVEDTTKPWTYNNRSIIEYNWNKNPARPSHIGNVKHSGSTVMTTERNKEDEDFDLDTEVKDYELKPIYAPTRATIVPNEYGKQKCMIERVPNLANIKRVQLNNSPVKSPTVNFKGEKEMYTNNNKHKDDIDDDDLRPEGNEFEHKKGAGSFIRRIYINQVHQNNYDTDKTAIFPSDNFQDSDAERETTFTTKIPEQTYKNDTTVKNLYSTKPTFITEIENFKNNNIKQVVSNFKITDRKSSENTESINVYTTEIVDVAEDLTSNKKLANTTKEESKNPVRNNHYEAESQDNNYSGRDENQANNVDHETNTKNNETQPIEDHHSEKGHVKKNDKSPYSTKSQKNKVNMENVIKFMRVVADTISRNSKRSFGGKMQYLHELKDSILANIEERIDAAWPDDDSAGARRRSRSAHETARGHVHVPSSESALMTISFLTFAVFLIKLVLQVIQTYKHKAMMVAPLMVASGRKVFSQLGQQ